MKLEILFEETNIEISYNPEAKTLHVNWKGNQTLGSMNRGCEKILEFMKARECCKVLTDNTLLSENWYNAATCEA
jgi:hypothetical protein